MSDANTLPKTYNPAEIEPEISKLWLRHRAFHATPDDRGPDERYVIMMPLPNVTGALHMGHAMDNVMQDLLIRWHRMTGDNTLWMPGTDHAGIGTQAVVEKRLKELEGITRHDLGREGLVARIWQWKDQYQARIIAQQQRMGCSCDWERRRFTMDKVCARAVRHAFFRMFRDRLIFRGKRLVNWDTYLRTTISDDEMYYETVAGFFWHLRYPVIDAKKGEPEFVSVATTRPETMLGDTAVAVHPDPEKALNEKIRAIREELSGAPNPELEEVLAALQVRKETILPGLIRLRDMALSGRQVMLPLAGRPIPLIADIWAQPDLGSGCVKITPAHDHNDYAVYNRHKDRIGIINILNPDGTLNEATGKYQGLDRFVARERVVADLKAQGLLEKIEEREIEIGHSDRSKTPVEPLLSDQWFVKMGDVPGGIRMGLGTKKEFQAPGLVQAAIDAVNQGRVTIHPARYTKTCLDWLAEKRDWPISRQLWWGHRIPVWSKLIKKADAGRDRFFTDLPVLLKKTPAVRASILMSIKVSGTEESVLIEDCSVINTDQFPGTETDELLFEICLLEDVEVLTAPLAAHGFVQDADVLDTWFSSALWPFSTLGWPDPETAAVEPGQAPLGKAGGGANCLDYYYPGSCLVTARDIITLWVARMVIAGLYNLGDIPFRDVFIHANILDGKGVRMSKSKGNGIDPVDIIDAYGTDAMRYVIADMQTGTQDIRLPVTAICPECGFHNDLGTTQHGSSIFCYVCGKNSDGSLKNGSCSKEFDVLGTLPGLKQAKLTSERFEIGRAFCTKLWNSARFAFMNLKKTTVTLDTKDSLSLEDRWILSCLSRIIRAVKKGLGEYNPSQALGAIRDFFWGSLCDWYLEAVKPRLGGSSANGEIASAVLAFCLDQIFRLLHPFVPFITEYLWQRLAEYAPERGLGNLAPAALSTTLIKARWPDALPVFEDENSEQIFAHIQGIIRSIREVRSERKIAPKQQLEATLKTASKGPAGSEEAGRLIMSLAGVATLHLDPAGRRPPGSVTKMIGETAVFVHGIIDDSKEKARLGEELQKLDAEIEHSRKKLDNDDFVKRAPAQVVEGQKKKLADRLAQRETLALNLNELENS
jgi:valyl-tRNA synthetase